MLTLKTTGHCFIKALVNTINHDGIEHAGYLAFLGLLALFPFLVFLVAFAGFIGAGDVGQEFVQVVFAQLPHRVAEALMPRVDEIISGPPQGLLTLAIIGAIWTSSSAVEGYRTVLNRAYHVATPPAYILRRLMSIAQLFILTVVVVISMSMLVIVPLLWEKLQTVFGIRIFGFELTEENKLFWGKVVIAISLFGLYCAVAALYYILPNIKQNFISVAPGAGVVMVLWLIAAWIFSFYLSHFQQVNVIYGSLGGIIAALIFFYISNIIFIYGAEFNSLIKHALGEPTVQKEAAAAPPPTIVDDK